MRKILDRLVRPIGLAVVKARETEMTYFHHYKEPYSPQIGRFFQLQEFVQNQSVPVSTSSFTDPTFPLCWLPLPANKDGIVGNSYYRSSVNHRLLSKLIQTIEARNGSFLLPVIETALFFRRSL